MTATLFSSASSSRPPLFSYEPNGHRYLRTNELRCPRGSGRCNPFCSAFLGVSRPVRVFRRVRRVAGRSRPYCGSAPTSDVALRRDLRMDGTAIEAPGARSSRWLRTGSLAEPGLRPLPHRRGSASGILQQAPAIWRSSQPPAPPPKPGHRELVAGAGCGDEEEAFFGVFVGAAAGFVEVDR